MGLLCSFAYFAMLDSQGKTIWNTDVGHEINSRWDQLTSEGGFMVCGSSCVFMVEKNVTFLRKYDARGQRIWEKPFSIEDFSYIINFEKTADYGFIGYVLARMEKKNFHWAAWLLKTDEFGNVAGQ